MVSELGKIITGQDQNFCKDGTQYEIGTEQSQSNDISMLGQVKFP